MNNQATPSTQASAKSRKRWTELEERTLIDGLKDLCVRGWRGENGTFRHGYLIELEHYICARLPNCGIKALPHIDSKVRAWKKNYGTISSLTSRSGLGFQYNDGCIVVDDQKAWEDYIKIDPNAKGMNSKTWPFYANWEEIFGKERATGEFAEGPLDAVEEMERNQEVPNVMRLGLLTKMMSEMLMMSEVLMMSGMLKMLRIFQPMEEIKLLRMDLEYQPEQQNVHSLVQLKVVDHKKVILLKHHLLKPKKGVKTKEEEQQLTRIMRYFLNLWR